MNKKGTDKILSVYWFAILLIVAGAIVFMVAIFYGKPLDVREAEANILINNVVDCLDSSDGLSSITNENFQEKCRLNLNEEYFLEIEKLELRQGNINLKSSCNLKGQKSIVCVKKSFYLSGNYYNILAVVSKEEKNVQ